MGRLKEKHTDNDYQITTLYGIETNNGADRITVSKSQPILTLPQTSLTLMELKLFDVYLGRINPKDPTVTKVVFTKQEFCKLIGVDKINNSKLESCLVDLMKCILKVYYVEKGKAKTDIFALLSHARITYDDKFYKGICAIELQCSKEAKKYIYNIHTVGYLKMNLAKVLSFDGRNPYSLYQYLCQNVFRGHWEVDINELKAYLGVGVYSEFKDFEKRVLKPSKKEIETKTDLKFEYKKIRVGRRIGKIAFQIIKNHEPVDEPELEDDKDWTDHLDEWDDPEEAPSHAFYDEEDGKWKVPFN